jgi:hypothetical protein
VVEYFDSDGSYPTGTRGLDVVRPTTRIAGCCACRERPRCRTAEKRDELASPPAKHRTFPSSLPTYP